MVDSRHALYARNAVALKEHLQNRFGLFDREVHPVQSPVTRICKDFSALKALITLTIPAFTEFPAFCSAVVACHYQIAPEFCDPKPDNWVVKVHYGFGCGDPGNYR